MTTIRLYVDTDDAPPPGREWLARIERGTTATAVWGSTRAEAREKAERAVAEEARLAKARGARAVPA
ncbi:hypothetical protein [Methylobacterium aquaticum]|jgi:hypothetical protein|uniref:Uncharacterized protein n=1 Tax=Methylobacterium aquaticum TaxID=270351 RepID=A0A0J6S0A0_9HYPH|nr:hypothetical protein [Methylobacterium aquaticum]KMO28555.1 hypothetical protein VP06_27150 [Methylobacterium aquaticum]